MGRLVQRLVFRRIQNGVQYEPVSRQVRDDLCQEPNRVLFVGVADHLSPDLDAILLVVGEERCVHWLGVYHRSKDLWLVRSQDGALSR